MKTINSCTLGLILLAGTSALAGNTLNCTLYEGSDAKGNGVNIISTVNQGTFADFQTSKTIQTIAGREVELDVTIDAQKVDMSAIDVKTKELLGSSFVARTSADSQLPTVLQFLFKVGRNRVGYLTCIR